MCIILCIYRSFLSISIVIYIYIFKLYMFIHVPSLYELRMCSKMVDTRYPTWPSNDMEDIGR